MASKPSITAQILADKLLREDVLNLGIVLGRRNLETLIDMVLKLHAKLRADLDRNVTRGLAPAKFDPQLSRQRKMTDEEQDAQR